MAISVVRSALLRIGQNAVRLRRFLEFLFRLSDRPGCGPGDIAAPASGRPLSAPVRSRRALRPALRNNRVFVTGISDYELSYSASSGLHRDPHHGGRSSYL